MTRPLQSRSITSIVFILAPLIFTFAFALDIYVPSIPEIRILFKADQDVMQLTVGLFLLVTGLGQLIAGPLSDQVGRRKIALFSALLFTLGSFICAYAPEITVLIVGRIIQASGACGMFVAAFAMVRDLFSGDECATIYSYLNATIALSPLFAPIIGGYIEYWWDWRICFIFLAVLGIIVILITYFFINETLAVDHRRLLQTEAFSDYSHVFKSKTFLAYAICASAGFSSFLTFFSSSPYILITLLKIPVEHFGYYFALMGVIFFFGSLLSGYLAPRIGTYSTALLGAFLILISGIAMCAWYYLAGLSIIGFLGPMLIMNIGGALAMGGSAGGAIEPFPEMAGTASAVFGSFQFVLAFIVSQIVLYYKVQSTLPLSITLMVMGIIAFIAVLMARNKKYD